MIKSMTGFGQMIANGEANTSVEVKSLNSKFLDLSMRLPKKFADKEQEVRLLVADILERGKISIFIESQRSVASEFTQRYDENLFVSNYEELKKLADKVMSGHDSLFQLALDSPGVKQSDAPETGDEGEWQVIISLLKEAASRCNSFREAEGKILKEKLSSYISNIESGLDQVTKLEPSRTEKIRARLKENISGIGIKEGVDENRLEQEMIYYIEKLDIQEELVRLKTHLDYFSKVMDDKNSNGKKLGFIAQEIGREINTIGSKANDASIQKHVVEMKDELEKIKEQLNNVL
ncbi:MAG: YicC/YloC family endoribonuclease [Cyclobacteriaceae bacterium]